MEEIKPIQNQNSNNRRKYLKISIPLAMMLFLVCGVFLTINTAQQNQDNRSKASTGSVTSTVTLYPTIDTYVSKTSSNNSSGSSLRVKGGSEPNITFMMFNLGSIPAGSTISSASLQMRTNGESDAVSYDSYPITLISTSWNSSVTYSSRPSISGTTVGTARATSRSTWYTYNLSTSPLAANAGKSVAFAMGGNSATDGMWFYSSETSNKPKLVITYTYTTATQIPTPTLAPTTAPTVRPTTVPTQVPTATPTPAPGVTITVAPTAASTATPVPTLPGATATPTATQPTSIPAPTATPVPGSTTANITLLLHGLGKGGDSVNPNSTGNMNPLHPQRNVVFDVYNVQNQLVMTKQGTVSFNSQTGSFSGNIDLGADFASGIYTVKVKTDQYLRGLMSGIQTITKGQVNTLPSVTLVSGDINNDNAINIVDYNIFVGCYSDLLPPASCNDSNLVRADLNDDSFVNQFDYNLFIRELTNIGGQ